MTSTRARVSALVGTAALVGLGYYVGVQVGLALRFPPATTSVLWPPNSILTAALLLTPPRNWWVCLAAALPVHFLMPHAVGWSMPFVGALFVTNCSEAVIAAGFLRAFSDAPLRFDTLRRVAVFIVGAVLLAPLLSSFADAAVVHGFQGEPYWTVWRTRLFANALTELSVVPLVVLVTTRGTAFLGELSPRRMLEAALLGCMLVAAAVLTFGGGTAALDLPGIPSTPTVFMLPLFFWAALRFGAGGMSTALLIAALGASFGARMGSRAFDVLGDPGESLLALQLYLIVMAVPLFAVSALLDERRRAASELAHRLRFEALLSDLSRSFVRSPSDRIAFALDDSLRSVGELFGADRVAIMRLAASGGELRVAHQWAAEGIPPLASTYSREAFPWVVERLLEGHEVVCEAIEDLPESAVRDRASFRELGLRSALVMPLVASLGVQGVISVHMLRARSWPAPVVNQLRMVAEVLGNALSRARADDAVRSSESMKAAILSSLSSLVAVLDKSGTIIAVNERWQEKARREVAPFAGADIGVNYLDVCRRAAADGDSNAREALECVRSVLEGRRASVSIEHAASDQEGRWYAMSLTHLQRPEGGVVVSHVDVTKRKRAELEAQRARQELAHFTRVSTMGELTASLAHQLNQPLTGILSNAQAARWMLDNGGLDVAELRETIADIVDDGRRAGDVIRRLRDLLTKGNRDSVVTDPNSLIRDVVTLMSSDAIIRNVPLLLELALDAPKVDGDPVELQQVMLNLVANAIDAVADQPMAHREVVVRSERTDGGVLVSVRDSGPGLGPGTEMSVFEPFFTTKSTGMGMGLAIARSIVESHEGRIWAANNDGCGATFYVRLPAASSSES